jgi:hypothetical protein
MALMSALVVDPFPWKRAGIARPFMTVRTQVPSRRFGKFGGWDYNAKRAPAIKSATTDPSVIVGVRVNALCYIVDKLRGLI